MTIKYRLINRFQYLLVVAVFILWGILSGLANAAVVDHSGTLSADETWSSTDTHRVTGNVVVPSGITLTIESGTIVKYNSGTRLTVDGTLVAVGNQASPITFTSYREDSVGGDTNGDGSSSGQAGDWQGVILGVDSVGNLIDYAEISYAQTGLDLRSDGVTVSNSVVEHSSQNGVRISDASPMIDANTLRNNRYGLYIQSGSPQVTGNVVRDNDDYGIWITTSGSAPLINGHNEITANTYGIYVQGNGNAALNPLPVVNGNDLYGNSQHDYHARSFGNAANVTLDATGNWWGTPDPTAIGAKIYDRAESPNSPTVDFGGYLDDSEGTSVGGNTLTGTFSVDTRLSTNTSHTVLGDLYVPQGVTLTLEAGVVLNFTNVYNLTVDGTLIVQGSQAEPVVLTSSRSAPSRGDWQGVILSADSVGNLIDYAEIRYAQTGLDLRSDGVTVSNSVVEHSSQNGIRINGASPMIDANTLRNNRYGLYIQSGSPQVTGNVVRDNDDYGIWITTSGSAPLINGRNEITANNRGIYVQGNSNAAFNPLPVVTGNDLYGNSQHDYYAASFGNAANVTLDATGNWWGTPDPTAIGAKIYDRSESAGSPTVNFSGYLDGSGGTGVGGNTLTGTFSVDTTLVTNTSHAVLGDLYVPQGVTLTLEAGVVLNFTNIYNLTVDGTLIVQGSQAEPVVLTSSRSAPSRGDWQGVILSADSVGNLIDYAEIRYAQTGLDLRSDGVTVSNSVVEHSSQNGIRINGASPMIDANTLRNNRYGLYIQSGSPQVTGNVVRDNDDYGIWITTSGSAPLINGRNEITANSRGIYVQGNSNAAFNPLPVVTGNDLYGNSQHDYYAASFGNAANVTLDATGNWWGTPDPTAIGAKIYDRSESAGSPTVNFSGYLDGSGGTGVGGNTLTGTFSVDTTLVTNTSHAVLGDLYVPQGVTLTLEAGVVLSFTNIYNLTVDGTLIVQGSEVEPVILTSSRSAPSRGDWQGVILSADSVGNLIDYAEISYAQTGLDLRSDGVTVSNGRIPIFWVNRRLTPEVNLPCFSAYSTVRLCNTPEALTSPRHFLDTKRCSALSTAG